MSRRLGIVPVLRLLISALGLVLASCGPSTHRFHEASFQLPKSWSQTAAPVPSAFAAVDASRDGYDLFMVVHKGHRGDPAAMPAGEFKQLMNKVADGSLQMMKDKKGFQNVTERSRGIGRIGDTPVIEQSVAARITWPNGQTGDVVLSSRVYARKSAVYHFTLRESAESQRRDPGYFKRLVDTVRFE